MITNPNTPVCTVGDSKWRIVGNLDSSHSDWILYWVSVIYTVYHKLLEVEKSHDWVNSIVIFCWKTFVFSYLQGSLTLPYQLFHWKTFVGANQSTKATNLFHLKQSAILRLGLSDCVDFSIMIIVIKTSWFSIISWLWSNQKMTA